MRRSNNSRFGANWLLFLLAVVVVLSTYAGWRAFWFLTDDAFITYRYISNSMAGYGWVWNPPPFHPVEGYTNFLWMVLLEAVWRLTGVEPPVSANWLSLFFGYATLYVGYRFVARMVLPEPFKRHRLALLTLVFLGTIANRTFLAWLSSGLETSLFNFCFTCWLYVGFTPPDKWNRGWIARLCLFAALTSLVRPDGLLTVAASAALVGWYIIRRLENGQVPWLDLAWSLPLLAIPIHFVWRRMLYGYWLPNTYYAKHVAPWPQAGIRYLLCFAIEYGVWVWLEFAVFWLWTELGQGPKHLWRSATRNLHGLITVGVLLAHFAYYTLRVGGDHFEYRVFSHLILLLFLSAVWLLVRIVRRPVYAYILMSGFLLASLPIGWTHWAKTKDLNTRNETWVMLRPIANQFPFPLWPLVDQWDRWQKWLIMRHVGMRHQEHKIFCEFSVNRLPTRAVGSRITWDQRAVMATGSVGVIGWVLPGVAIIDVLGLNDRVVARSPIVPGRMRMMAHDRRPPTGYVDAFRPNVLEIDLLERRILQVRKREQPLTDEEIREAEAKQWN